MLWGEAQGTRMVWREWERGRRDTSICGRTLTGMASSISLRVAAPGAAPAEQAQAVGREPVTLSDGRKLVLRFWQPLVKGEQ